MISASLVNESVVGAKSNVKFNKTHYIFDYPCDSNSECTDYKLILEPGAYKFELYGASGGSRTNEVSSYRFSDNNCIEDEIVQKYRGNTKCIRTASVGGAGGYISHTIQLMNQTVTFLTLGGRGIYGHKIMEYGTPNCFVKQNMVSGGYGGGGSSSNFCGTDADSSGILCGTGSGGGQTAVKFLNNDYWHRVLVSGGGGGCDNGQGTYGELDDGSGGAGRNLTAQSWFANGVLKNEYFADSEKGFSFGVGEAARYGTSSNVFAVREGLMFDNAGAGGGWFGGFSAQLGSAGAGVGSSWALSKDAIIPKVALTSTDELYNNKISRYYAFNLTSGYLFEDVVNVAGIWNGNGRVVITIIKSNYSISCLCKLEIQSHFLFLIFAVS
ncbi:hypothetical protein TVAG_131830 [Trichomonas vaginalis G3]|uniref:receptor protein-tyrosine kinase n=1 Tax=Trichomonas vaginalis (strain ATCC PRA-98 / G3) TaxID=412133 RepID=A2FMG2_TRIV3|nr:glycine-rich protein family [Trichomonas vaginalis G3]EAX93895.1 hypothetical protein TVAG_131830 [Trichomonas vaginalis G3]KAI5534320.1 glycine-rich protein family [Trichomonas vaginalis G3]|eukprot:XP_001306825.1 hypothetical protein [Trichomonas vaginalis G3]